MVKINALIILFFQFRRKAFRASLLSQQWKVLSPEVRFTRRPLDTRSIVRKQTKCHHYVPPEKKMKLVIIWITIGEKHVTFVISEMWSTKSSLITQWASNPCHPRYVSAALSTEFMKIKITINKDKRGKIDYLFRLDLNDDWRKLWSYRSIFGHLKMDFWSSTFHFV